ncbi:hypothetical protein PCANC_22597 [Puccinia coronata f. sp. avenae]|uniref:Uncharacterized protein n=1 Tax=Puccinia coronata f. sp. avenae TaxID=200324 RepID=A0A2N5SM63_9BASI|nr:hypothetical protein PCANC_22597 [Puccinia coronata f. sp. avenae]
MNSHPTSPESRLRVRSSNAPELHRGLKNKSSISSVETAKSASRQIALPADKFSVDVSVSPYVDIFVSSYVDAFVSSYVPRHGFRKQSRPASFLGPFATTKRATTP